MAEEPVSSAAAAAESAAASAASASAAAASAAAAAELAAVVLASDSAAASDRRAIAASAVAASAASASAAAASAAAAWTAAWTAVVAALVVASAASTASSAADSAASAAKANAASASSAAASAAKAAASSASSAAASAASAAASEGGVAAASASSAAASADAASYSAAVAAAAAASGDPAVSPATAAAAAAASAADTAATVAEVWTSLDKLKSAPGRSIVEHCVMVRSFEERSSVECLVDKTAKVEHIDNDLGLVCLTCRIPYLIADREVWARCAIVIQVERVAAACAQAITAASDGVAALSIVPPATMSLKDRFFLLRSIGEKCLTTYDLLGLLKKKTKPVVYCRIEPLGKMHMAQVVMKAINVIKLTSADCIVKFWISDWFAQLNNEMGGDLRIIQKFGLYFIEILKAVGMRTDGVEFVWSSEEIKCRPMEYQSLVMGLAGNSTVSRIESEFICQKNRDNLTADQFMHLSMQCADILFLEPDICLLGMDQMISSVLVNDYCDAIKTGMKSDSKMGKRPISLLHHMLPGLGEGQETMSTTCESSSIFMEDDEENVINKIMNASCPPRNEEKRNPCLEYIKFIVFPWFGQFEVKQSDEGDRDKTYTRIEEVVKDYEDGALRVSELKSALAKALNKILQPVRDHFKDNMEAKKLLETVKAWQKVASS